MSPPPGIVIECIDSSDTLEMSCLPMGAYARVKMHIVEAGPDGDEVSVHLDAAKAREVFNWLGIWLHTV